MEKFLCPYLQGEVELSASREQHIAERHPELLQPSATGSLRRLPTQTRSAAAPGWRVPDSFPGGYDDVRGGKHLVLVVVGLPGEARHWIVTAYIARKLAGGKIEWRRS
jgi:hypothetical protein